jgi:hypothetical protein
MVIDFMEEVLYFYSIDDVFVCLNGLIILGGWYIGFIFCVLKVCWFGFVLLLWDWDFGGGILWDCCGC